MPSTLSQCVSSIAKSFAPACSGLIGGYTGRAVVFDMDDANLSITAGTDAYTILDFGENASPIAVINYGDQPFNGSNTASTNENGLPEYTKTVQFMIPKRGAATAKDIDNLRKKRFIVVAEKEDVDQISGGAKYEVIGSQRPLKVNGDGVTRNEYDNGGAWSVTASTRESYAEVDFNPFGSVGDPTAKEIFEEWLAAAPAQ